MSPTATAVELTFPDGLVGLPELVKHRLSPVPDSALFELALEELEFFSREVRILGVYPASPFRRGV